MQHHTLLEMPPFNKNRKLAFLFRDRHNDLLFVCKIRRAIRTAMAHHKIIRFIQEEFLNEFQPNFIEEEQWLFSKIPSNHPLRIKAEEQHTELINLIMTTSPECKLYDSLPETFANLLEEHIRFEVRTLFPYIEQSMYQKTSVA
jgi:hypothetical protein